MMYPTYGSIPSRKNNGAGCQKLERESRPRTLSSVSTCFCQAFKSCTAEAPSSQYVARTKLIHRRPFPLSWTMVQLYAISIFRTDVKPAVKLVSTQDVSSFGFFQRSAVSQFIDFFSQTVAERTPSGQRSDVEENSKPPIVIKYSNC